MLSNQFIESFRYQLKTDLQTLLSYVSGLNTIKEATVVQEFQDTAEIYPCVVIDITTGNSPARHIGANPKDLIHVDIYMLAIRPTKNTHIITCSDTVTRSGRGLAEYVAVKVNNYLKNYKPADNVFQWKSDLILNPDYPERDGVYKTIVQYEFII